MFIFFPSLFFPCLSSCNCCSRVSYDGNLYGLCLIVRVVSPTVQGTCVQALSSHPRPSASDGLPRPRGFTFGSTDDEAVDLPKSSPSGCDQQSDRLREAIEVSELEGRSLEPFVGSTFSFFSFVNIFIDNCWAVSELYFRCSHSCHQCRVNSLRVVIVGFEKLVNCVETTLKGLFLAGNGCTVRRIDSAVIWWLTNPFSSYL